ncbi:maltokinase N-terminal cap-like domain-containing protein [Devriesea agamarum]|uniref:maltokinase N-terminal cap-like domain-containing protein n=1 Tax=Devriesea agamarum TaxID=472569 RepID=UPI00071CB654|nr:phosphotransferase [Devriesea agamarum]
MDVSDEAPHTDSASPGGLVRFSLRDELPSGALPQIAQWMRHARWYTGASSDLPRLYLRGQVQLPGVEGPLVHLMLLEDTASSTPVLYAVPLQVFPCEDVHHSRPHQVDPHAVIGQTHDGMLVDATRSASGRSAILRATLTACLHPGSVTSSRCLSTEQSNTSMVFEFDDAEPIIVKLFRVIQPGLNPDIELQTALSAHHCPHLAPVRGSLEAQWPLSDDHRVGKAGSDTLPDVRVAHGHLGIAQQFIPDTTDGWAFAIEQARQGRDIADDMVTLGQATRSVHASLRDAFGEMPLDPQPVLARMRAHLNSASHTVPQLRKHTDAVHTMLDRAVHRSWPSAQRIHGDLHLGQVIRDANGRWVFLDFEGEPMRPLSERSQPDAAMRDLAGMLRSIDYAAAFAAMAPGKPAPGDATPGDPVPGDATPDSQAAMPLSLQEWAQRARIAYLSGYGFLPGPGSACDLTVLAAYEIDKAIYEAVYETSYRPSWAPIPLSAIERLTSNIGPAGSPYPSSDGTNSIGLTDEYLSSLIETTPTPPINGANA